jgi:dienelactone hydrolase
MGEKGQMVNLAKANSISGWPSARAQIESTVSSVLGPIANKDRVELQTKTVDEISFPGYTRRRVNYFVDEWERVSAWLMIPDRKDEMPAILCCHSECPQGKDEPAGLEGEPLLALAQHYVEMGYVTIAPDCVTAGDRTSTGLNAYDTKTFYKDNPKMSAMGKMLSDHMYAIDVLSEVKRVDSARIGVAGHGMGAANALFLTAFDERIQACVASCGFTRFANDKNPERWAAESGFVLFPQLREAVKSKEFPFDWEHILALLAPSPTLVLTALNDGTLSNTKSCDKALQLAGSIYKLLGAQDALSHFTHDGGRRITPDGLEIADEWFERWL